MSKIKDKIEAMRGGGHHVPVGLDAILEDLEARIVKLEGGDKKSEPKPDLKHDLKPSFNPLDGERSDS
jgi:hypothetical protein